MRNKSILEDIFHQIHSNQKSTQQELGIYIFSAGQGGQAIQKYLSEAMPYGGFRYRIKAFFDNDAAKQGTIVNSIPVIRLQPDIIASLNYCYDMETQLLKLGVADGKIILPGSWFNELMAMEQSIAFQGPDLHRTLLKPELYQQYVELLYKQAAGKSVDFVEDVAEFQVNLQEDDIKLIAFYLPQFHPIPENDAWWGKGFTEWTNVTKAVPQFIGHHQPQLPIDLGFYDLRNIEAMRRQIELAHKYGVYGFCFYHYWFAGKRLLETPINNLLEHSEVDMPFCLCWANENWTRRWDGMNHEILIGQQHSPEDDLAFIKDAARYFKDPRYIKVNGKLLFILYRPLLLPDLRQTVELWRDFCRQEGLGELFIAGIKAFGFNKPYQYGLDALVEFPPNSGFAPDITAAFSLFNPDFSGHIYDYTYYAKRKDFFKSQGCVTFQGVMPGWDNTARRPNNPAIFHGSAPAAYQRWLENAICDTKQNASPEHQIVFINAWNEWAEGAHLEPDRKFGYGNLRATANALLKSRK